ncbi:MULTISPECIES: hypothetical protein [unclassified Lentimonas]|uniref:hypothetical protein n=1 Tax=unclassified Lentimonas TaxID=2630993 RepID=UPI001320A6E4|nr:MULTISPECIES: hypothetical protein [unclassified Lentimonas]CAA6692150.1 Unannotated [Lentimonas sp. CC19]CAA6697016.1 Unannotated [Lentimonas sp. CC10]CAA7070597.1 Unannotated [Lentimonas sp. CC11]
MYHLPLTLFIRLLIFATALFSAALNTHAMHHETKGIVDIELEDTDSPLGLWELKETQLNNAYSGDGYLEFTGNSPVSGDPQSPLEYEFTINKGGLYYLHLRCAKEVLEIKGKQRSDIANDCYVRVEGDFAAGPNAGDAHRKDAPLALLQADTKFFGGADKQFEWVSGNRLDPGGHNNKRVAVYDFKAGETYKLVVSGRSQFFKVDRLVFRHKDVPASAVEGLTQHSNAAPTSKSNDFNKAKDLFIAQFDSLPDSDDIHAQAAVGCLLAHPDFEGVNYFAVAGAYGVQVKNSRFKYIDSRRLFDLAFGFEALPTDTAEQRAQARWVNAHERIIYGTNEDGYVVRSPERIAQMNFASDVVKAKAKPILEAGGRVFVMDAGQSDFTADWVAKLIADGVTNTATNVILVQHSIWNERHTAGHPDRGALFTDGKNDWSYINDPTILTYVQLDDGNNPYGAKPSRGPKTPNYKNADTHYLPEAIDPQNPNIHARELWLLAKEIVDGSSYWGKVLTNGGVDFSDTVEAMWIFDLSDESAGRTTVRGFWDAYVVNGE